MFVCLCVDISGASSLPHVSVLVTFIKPHVIATFLFYVIGVMSDGVAYLRQWVNVLQCRDFMMHWAQHYHEAVDLASSGPTRQLQQQYAVWQTTAMLSLLFYPKAAAAAMDSCRGSWKWHPPTSRYKLLLSKLGEDKLEMEGDWNEIMGSKERAWRTRRESNSMERAWRINKLR